MIHLAVLGEHANQSPIHGLAFAAAACIQALWAFAFVILPSVAVRAGGIAVNGVIVLTWAMSRTIGLPDALGGGLPEPIGPLDLVATAFEVALVGLLLVTVSTKRFQLRPSAARTAAAVFAIAATTVTVLGVPAHDHHGAGAAGGHGSTPGHHAAARHDPASTHEGASNDHNQVAATDGAAGGHDGDHPQPEPPDREPGVVTFGLDMDATTLEVTNPQDHFRVGDAVHWRADFAEPLAATPVVVEIVTADGGGASLWWMESPIHGSGLKQLAAEADLVEYVDHQPGRYVLRLVQDGSVIAEGAFTVDS
jgi:hypothetical protein